MKMILITITTARSFLPRRKFSPKIQNVQPKAYLLKTKIIQLLKLTMIKTNKEENM
jgi:hypothetical protein